MKLIDKFLNVMKLNSDDDDFYDDDFYDDDDDDAEPIRKPVSRRKSVDEESESIYNRTETRERSTGRTSSKITPIRSTRKTASNGMEVCVIKPVSMDDAREITDTLLDNRTVVLNVEGLDVDIAQRIIDFTSGSCYAMHGNLQKISNYIFIITPANVDISGDFLNFMDAFDTSGIQTDF